MRTLFVPVSVALLVLASGCNEYGLGKHAQPEGDVVDPGGKPGSEPTSPGDPDAPRDEQDPLAPFPGEDRPPGWEVWDASCRSAQWAAPGPVVTSYTVDEPVEALTLLHTVGDVRIVPRPGPIEVEFAGVELGGAQGPVVEDGHLTLDYASAVGAITVYAPSDLLSYDLRLCIGNLSFSELENHVVTEVRIGNLSGDRLLAEDLWAHQELGNVDVSFDEPPRTLWMHGKSGGNLAADMPADRCDCDLDVTRAGLARTQGMDDDPAAPLSVWARLSVGNIVVRGD